MSLDLPPVKGPSGAEVPSRLTTPSAPPLSATFAGAASLALSERAVRDLGALELTFYSSAMTSTMLVPLFLAAEVRITGKGSPPGKIPP